MRICGRDWSVNSLRWGGATKTSVDNLATKRLLLYLGYWFFRLMPMQTLSTSDDTEKVKLFNKREYFGRVQPSGIKHWCPNSPSWYHCKRRRLLVSVGKDSAKGESKEVTIVMSGNMYRSVSLENEIEGSIHQIDRTILTLRMETKSNTYALHKKNPIFSCSYRGGPWRQEIKWNTLYSQPLVGR